MYSRRQILATLAPLGLAGTVLGRALATTLAGRSEITLQSLLDAEWITGVTLDEEQRAAILESVRRNTASLASLRAVPLDETTPMATGFTPLRGLQEKPSSPATTTVLPVSGWTVSKRPADHELAFLPVTELGELLRNRMVSSLELTRLYIDRLKKFDPVLHCVVNLTEELAMDQAERADREIGLGRYRGPLHGIPWGAKDLISVCGYPATWGIPDRRQTVAQTTATIAQKLEQAGAVLVAKLSLGALAMGDQWFGGMTRNPWNPERGSSGSSAGSAAATVAGMVGFAVGTETLGSIVSPSTRCGTTSLRPTFGRISRDGCMPLSWTFDKLGPMCRSVEDCALVFAAIHGSDGRDPSAIDRSFTWPQQMDLKRIRVGIPERSLDDDADESVRVLKSMGVQLVPVKLPDSYPMQSLLNIIDVEAAAMFDTLLREGKTDGWNRWPEIFRAAFYLPAVDYVRMQRVRMQLMREFEQAISGVDFLMNSNDLLHTNLTGHPSVILPRVIELSNGRFRPRTTVLTGQAYDDDRLLGFAREFESRVGGGLEHPPMQRWLDEMKAEKPPAADESSPSDSRASSGNETRPGAGTEAAQAKQSGGGL